ncbi:MAG: DCC1-like thiol-disulfide oxidoreductase family protein [Bacteroidota bacterium]
MHKSGSHLPNENGVVLFDGYCNLCNGAVQFILKRDRKEHFRFASLSWPITQEIMQQFPEVSEVDSILLYEDQKLLIKSSAALRIAGHLGGLWPLLKVFLIVPPFIRDAVYDWIARNRYKWFGKKPTCMIPEKRVDHLFLKNSSQ